MLERQRRLNFLVEMRSRYQSKAIWAFDWYRAYRTRNRSSEDEIANVNFLYDDIAHVLQNIIDSCINSATDRRGGCGGTYVCQIHWNNAM